MKNTQTHYAVISFSLSIVCFNKSLVPTLILQFPRTVLMVCLANPSFTVTFFAERICYFTICHLTAITAVTLDCCVCWLRTTVETGDTFYQVLHIEKLEMMLSSVTQGTPREPPQILNLILSEIFTDTSLSKTACQKDNFTIIWCYKMLEKYFKICKTLENFNSHSWPL